MPENGIERQLSSWDPLGPRLAAGLAWPRQSSLGGSLVLQRLPNAAGQGRTLAVPRR